ncbi:hypothetical protein [Sphingomonas sp.]|uniref:hypothetical protein n=1 Tax=Sphingomonas sp. TaxID=28214 RepID=UPI003B008E6C
MTTITVTLAGKPVTITDIAPYGRELEQTRNKLKTIYAGFDPPARSGCLPVRGRSGPSSIASRNCGSRSRPGRPPTAAASPSSPAGSWCGS